MEENKQIRLTATEMASLWYQYLNDSARICMLSYFLEKAEDAEIKPMIEHALQLSKTQLQTLTTIFTKENCQIPYGFKIEEDVDLTAPRLYSDGYVLHFLHQMASIGLNLFSAGVAASVRTDITDFYMECLTDTMQLYKMTKDLLLSKGMYIRSPYLPNSQQAGYVEKQGFVWDIFGEKRQLSSIEIANLHANILRNALGTAILMGFIQVSKSKEVRQYFLRGKEIAKKHIELFGKKLKENDLPVPMTWESEVTESTAYTFSDKLMMFFTNGLISLSIGYYGISVSQSPRVDLGVMYNRLSAEIQLYSEDGANLMIKNKWMEQPPMAYDRDKIKG